ncbi:hypothetical protein TWF506_003201 [Arthrobotrys conoides]|uniref:Uncharacterized protein n=1 Tax=Arthrobotrys conoides TaxID=74498 RepID=A0AAN8NCC9_9PEZI
MAGSLRKKDTEHNIRQLYLDQATEETGESSGPSHDPAQATMGTDSPMQRNPDETPLERVAGGSQRPPQDSSSSSAEWTGPNIDDMRIASKTHLLDYPWLAAVEAENYIYFVEVCLEEAIWWIETRLAFEKYTTVPTDAFKDLFDDPDEALTGYGFLTEDKNKNLVNKGFFDILSNYRKRTSGTEPPPAGFLRPAEIEAATPPPPPPPPPSRGEKIKNFFLGCGLGFGGKKKKPVKKECDRIGHLLMGAGYRPDPANNPTIAELHKGDYPDPTQYHNDVQIFLELIMCLLYTTCPKIVDVRDILTVSFVNDVRGYRSLRYENGHLVIVSYSFRANKYFRTIIPDPLSRLILIFLIDIRPFIALINTDETIEKSHWHQEYLFPSKKGGAWTMDMMNDILESHTKRQLGFDIGLGMLHLRAVYFNLESQLGEGWLCDVVETVDEDGVTTEKNSIKWSRVPPAATIEGHPGGSRYLSKYYSVG